MESAAATNDILSTSLQFFKRSVNFEKLYVTHSPNYEERIPAHFYQLGISRTELSELGRLIALQVDAIYNRVKLLKTEYKSQGKSGLIVSISDTFSFDADIPNNSDWLAREQRILKLYIKMFYYCVRTHVELLSAMTERPPWTGRFPKPGKLIKRWLAEQKELRDAFIHRVYGVGLYLPGGDREGEITYVVNTPKQMKIEHSKRLSDQAGQYQMQEISKILTAIIAIYDEMEGEIQKQPT